MNDYNQKKAKLVQGLRDLADLVEKSHIDIDAITSRSLGLDIAFYTSWDDKKNKERFLAQIEAIAPVDEVRFGEETNRYVLGKDRKSLANVSSSYTGFVTAVKRFGPISLNVIIDAEDICDAVDEQKINSYKLKVPKKVLKHLKEK